MGDAVFMTSRPQNQGVLSGLSHQWRGASLFGLWGALKNPSAQTTPQTNPFKILGSGTPAAVPFKALQEIPMCTQEGEPLFWMVPEASISTSQVVQDSLETTPFQFRASVPWRWAYRFSPYMPPRILGKPTQEENCSMKDRYSCCWRQNWVSNMIHFTHQPHWATGCKES